MNFSSQISKERDDLLYSIGDMEVKEGGASSYPWTRTHHESGGGNKSTTRWTRTRVPVLQLDLPPIAFESDLFHSLKLDFSTSCIDLTPAATRDWDDGEDEDEESRMAAVGDVRMPRGRRSEGQSNGKNGEGVGTNGWANKGKNLNHSLPVDGSASTTTGSLIFTPPATPPATATATLKQYQTPPRKTSLPPVPTSINPHSHSNPTKKMATPTRTPTPRSSSASSYSATQFKRNGNTNNFDSYSLSTHSPSPSPSRISSSHPQPSPKVGPRHSGHGHLLSASTTSTTTSISNDRPSPRASVGSGVSVATSNSSFRQPPVPHSSNNNSSAALSDVDHTAALIKRLYERLDQQGVPGDGWDEGRERSRDGIIGRENLETLESPDYANGGRPPRIERGGPGRNSVQMEDQILKRVDRYVASLREGTRVANWSRTGTASSHPHIQPLSPANTTD
ncbi:hypothetical protein P7C70_g3307, partial [Phenoliferia sp. Uapishka_3]